MSEIFFFWIVQPLSWMPFNASVAFSVENFCQESCFWPHFNVHRPLTVWYVIRIIINSGGLYFLKLCYVGFFQARGLVLHEKVMPTQNTLRSPLYTPSRVIVSSYFCHCWDHTTFSHIQHMCIYTVYVLNHSLTHWFYRFGFVANCFTILYFSMSHVAPFCKADVFSSKDEDKQEINFPFAPFTTDSFKSICVEEQTLSTLCGLCKTQNFKTKKWPGVKH